MKKEEVELMIIGVKMAGEEILLMKIYKDGTLTRSGCGGMPTFAISGMTVEGTREYWDELIPLVGAEIVENPVMYEDEEIATPLEYYLAFYGASDNGETGERANWTKASGLRFLLDSNTTFRHPLLGFLDSFAMKAAEVTNKWFFDIVMSAVYGHNPVGLLGNTMVTAPKTDQEKQEALARYVNQIEANNARGWDICRIGDGRKYLSPDGVELTVSVEKKAGSISINFFEVFEPGNAASEKRLNEVLEKIAPAPRKTDPPAQDSEAAKPAKPEAGKPAKKWWEIWK